MKESCNLIKQKHIPVYNLKLCVEEKRFFFIQNQSIFYFELLLIWSYPLDQPKAHMLLLSLDKLECGWPRMTIPNQKYDLQSFLFLVTISI